VVGVSDHARVELYRRPGATGYTDVQPPARDERLSPLAFPDLVVTPAELLGP
jgi:Uma2 family endonuclease